MRKQIIVLNTELAAYNLKLRYLNKNLPRLEEHWCYIHNWVHGQQNRSLIHARKANSFLDHNDEWKSREP